jgi:hypothetical protein
VNAWLRKNGQIEKWSERSAFSSLAGLAESLAEDGSISGFACRSAFVRRHLLSILHFMRHVSCYAPCDLSWQL